MRTNAVARILLTAAAAMTGASIVDAQSGAPARFEVASVKTNRSGEPFQIGPLLQQNGRVFAINLPLRTLIRIAHALEENQVIGGPCRVSR